MKPLKTAALALALAPTLATPGTALAAGDGDLGATSSASMNVSVTVAPDTDDHVQILGLEDVVFADFVAGQQGGLDAMSQWLCLNKNTPGPVTLTFDQPDLTSLNFDDTGFYVNDLISGPNNIDIGIVLVAPGGLAIPTSDTNGWFGFPATSPSSCSASSGLGTAFRLYFSTYSETPVVAGTYSNTFTLTLSAG